MKNKKDGFDLSKAQRINPKKRKALIEAAEKKLGRPLRPPEEKHKPISIKLHPKVYAWAKSEAKKREQGYQTIINETLLKIANKKLLK